MSRRRVYPGHPSLTGQQGSNGVRPPPGPGATVSGPTMMNPSTLQPNVPTIPSATSMQTSPQGVGTVGAPQVGNYQQNPTQPVPQQPAHTHAPYAQPAVSTADLSSQFGQMNMQRPATQPNTGYQQPQQRTGATGGAGIISLPKPASQCPYKYMSPTVRAIPATSTLLDKSQLPLGVVVHPLANPTTDEEQVPLVNFGSAGVIRCTRCRGYLNAFVDWVEGGRRWRCNLCAMLNDVNPEYFAPADAQGVRSDALQRPELHRGIVEYVAPAEYMVRPPQPPVYFFVIDTTYFGVASGMYYAAVETIKSALAAMSHPRTKVGFITFDRTVQYYALTEESVDSQPRMLVVTEVDDIFLPVAANELVVTLEASRRIVDQLLDHLPTLHRNAQQTESCTGAALRAALGAMERIGGRIMLFQAARPSVGVGKLRNRDQPTALGTDQEQGLLLPEGSFYKDFALEASKVQVSFNVFLFASPQYTDVPALGTLPRYTGGELFFYGLGTYAGTQPNSLMKFRNDLWRSLMRTSGLEAVMRVRCSKGVVVKEHIGNFFIRSSDLLALPSVDSDKSFSVQLVIEENLTQRRHVSIQSALLYTTMRGERRIRVSTICLPVTTHLSDLFKYADCASIVNVLAKRATEKALASKLSDAREAVLNKCIDILSVYRASFASASSSATQLVLPESLKLFPLYILALLKHTTLRGGNTTRPDDRVAAMHALRTLPVTSSLSYIYPRLYAIGPVEGNEGLAGEQGIVLPTPVSLLSEKLDRTRVHLLDTGNQLLLWIGKTANPEVCTELFGGVPAPNTDPLSLALPVLETDLNKRLHNILQHIRSERHCYPALLIVPEGSSLEHLFFQHFVEDRSLTLPSYYEFLVQLQRHVGQRVGR